MEAWDYYYKQKDPVLTVGRGWWARHTWAARQAT